MAVSEPSLLDIHVMVGTKSVMESFVTNERLIELFPNLAEISLAGINS